MKPSFEAMLDDLKMLVAYVDRTQTYRLHECTFLRRHEHRTFTGRRSDDV